MSALVSQPCRSLCWWAATGGEHDGLPLFACAGCGLPVYRSEHKFDSRTGWPSFFQPVADAVGTSEDWSLLGLRTEVHCRRCGGHLGHVFDDGPGPTGLRYCINSCALDLDANKS